MIPIFLVRSSGYSRGISSIQNAKIKKQNDKSKFKIYFIEFIVIACDEKFHSGFLNKSPNGGCLEVPPPNEPFLSPRPSRSFASLVFPIAIGKQQSERE